MTALIDFGPAIVGLLLTLLLADTAFNSRATARGWRILLPFGRPADPADRDLLPCFSGLRRRLKIDRQSRYSDRMPKAGGETVVSKQILAP